MPNSEVSQGGKATTWMMSLETIKKKSRPLSQGKMLTGQTADTTKAREELEVSKFGALPRSCAHLPLKVAFHCLPGTSSVQRHPGSECAWAHLCLSWVIDVKKGMRGVTGVLERQRDSKLRQEAL